MSSLVNGNLIGKLSIGQGPQGLPGKDGKNGVDGKSLEFNWNGTELGVKKEGQPSYSYVNLKGQDGRDGVDGTDGTNGKDGVTPNITIGTVTTLEPGTKATVSRRGTIENPIFDFGIPQGNRGLQGLKGADGVTPVKGQDYYTNEEKEELIVEILKRIPDGNEVAY